MRLLVSVANSVEAQCALDGGADVIDAKDPLKGALGPVPRAELDRIRAAVAGRRLVTAALGDAMDEDDVHRMALEYAARGAAFVKIGFSGISDSTRVTLLIRAAVHGARANGNRGGVVAVAYADASPCTVTPLALVDAAAEGGAIGVLLDTANKLGPGLRHLITAPSLRDWVTAAHDAGLLAGLAGKLTIADLTFVRDAGADIAGVRGAACEGGRGGHVVADNVRRLRLACIHEHTRHS